MKSTFNHINPIYTFSVVNYYAIQCNQRVTFNDSTTNIIFISNKQIDYPVYRTKEDKFYIIKTRKNNIKFRYYIKAEVSFEDSIDNWDNFELLDELKSKDSIYNKLDIQLRFIAKYWNSCTINSQLYYELITINNQ